MPNVGKIQKLADYFGIGKSDLTDLKESREPDKEYADTTLKIALYDERFKKIIIEYSKLPSAKRICYAISLKHLFFRNDRDLFPCFFKYDGHGNLRKPHP